MPTFDLYPEFKNEKLMRQNCTNTTMAQDLCLNSARRALSAASNQTQEAIEIVNRGLVFVNDTFLPIINLTMKASID